MCANDYCQMRIWLDFQICCSAEFRRAKIYGYEAPAKVSPLALCSFIYIYTYIASTVFFTFNFFFTILVRGEQSKGTEQGFDQQKGVIIFIGHLSMYLQSQFTIINISIASV